MTQFLSTPVDKSLSATGAWTDIDLSGDVPTSATGAIFQVRSTHGSIAYQFGLRKKGSTDNRYKDIWYDSHVFCVVGVDANRKCQGKIENAVVDFHLVGYTEGDATLFTNAYDKSQSTTGVWTDLDLSSELPAGSVAAIFQIENVAGSGGDSWGLRKKGSTDDRYGDLWAAFQIYAIIGVDANRKCQFKIESTDVDFYLLGYLSSGTAETNGVDRSLGSTGSYTDITESSAPSGSSGVFVDVATSSVLYEYAAREKGASGDIYDEVGEKKASIFVGLDSNKKWEGKISNTGVDFYTLGYFAADTIMEYLAGTISASSSLSAVCGVSRKLSGTTSSISTLSGSLSSTKKIVGTITSAATLTGILEKLVPLAGSISATSSVSGTSKVQWSLKGSISATSSVSGSLSAQWSLKGDISATSSVSAAASVVWSLKGGITATSSVSGSIIKVKYLTGTISANSTISGTLTSLSLMSGTISAVSSLQGILSHVAPDRGFYYAKLGSTILTSIEKDSFRITEELNKIPSFEFEIANCSDNRTTIAAGITDVLTLYRRINAVDTLMFTGIINGDAIEYLSLERIRITGYASYIDLNWRFHQHLNSEDAETVDTVFDSGAAYTDYTTEANNDTVNDVILNYSVMNHALYLGMNETFFGAQIKYSTKGVQAGSTTVVVEYSTSGAWSTLDVLDETRAFTEDVGTYYLVIPHKPSDWIKQTINGVKRFWIRFRITAGSYTTPPKLDRIKITNVDIYRVYYLDTAADTIMDDVLAGTGYSMDVTDACPSDTISIVAEYETKLRFIAGVANALTWDDGGDKKAYQWWVDTSKKVHFKQKRGATLGDITADLTILNNIEDYFNLSNRLHFLANYDGLNQLRAVIEDTGSQDTHEIREIAVLEERFNNYIPLKEAAQKAMTYTKAPLQKIAATVTTKYWLDNGFEVGDTVTLHKDTWNVDSTAFQIVRADIGPRVTNVDLGISQEHLDGLKASLQRQLDISGIQMHGSTTLLQFGPGSSNYQRIDASTTYPSKLKFEIPSDARYIHKVLISWKLGPYRSSVGGSDGETGAGSGHDHTGYTGSSSAHDHTGYTGAGGEATPSELGEGEHTHTDAGYNTYYTLSGYLLSTKYTGYESAHTHPKGRTDWPDDTAYALTGMDTHNYCEACDDWIVQTFDSGDFAKGSHWHLNTGLSTGVGTSHRHDYPLASGTAFKYVRDPITTYVVLDTDPNHVHTHNLIAAHNDHLVASQAGESLTVATEPGESLPLTYDIKEIAGGTQMQLIVNGEDVTIIDGDGTNVIITGFTNTGSNTIELEPVVGSNTKGSASIEGRGVLFIETSSF